MRTFTLLFLLSSLASAQDIAGELIQYDWPMADGTYVMNSRAGAVRLRLDDQAAQLLDENGGGWINISVQNNVSGGHQWIVRNIYASFPTVESMMSAPVVLPIGIGDVSGLPWQNNLLDVELTPTPQDAMNMDGGSVTVLHEVYPYPIGGLIFPSAVDGGSGCTDANTAAMQGQGGASSSATQDPQPTGGARHPVGIGGLGKIDFEGKDCGPASVTASIEMMAGVRNHPLPSTQDLFKRLKENMKTDETGTTTSDLLDGKNKTTCELELPVCSQIIGWEFLWLIQQLIADGHDVEIMYKQGDCSDPCAPGHMAVIEGIINLDNGETVFVTGEPRKNPAPGEPAWERNFLPVRPDGTIRDANGNVIFCFMGFFAEFWSDDPFCLCSQPVGTTEDE